MNAFLVEKTVDRGMGVGGAERKFSKRALREEKGTLGKKRAGEPTSMSMCVPVPFPTSTLGTVIGNVNALVSYSLKPMYLNDNEPTLTM